jgi:NADPH:quinone reductase-like Zn-dependent oxidoreductase
MPTLPLTMNAVVLEGHGGFDRLAYRTDLPLPTPSAGEVLVRVRAAGVNNTDINMRTGWYSKSVTGEATAATGLPAVCAAAADDAGWTGAKLTFPRIQGADACGHIVAAGPGVDPACIGQRVIVEPVFRGQPGAADPAAEPVYFGSDCPGAFADYVCVPSGNAHRITSELTDAELASFPCSYSAAENMLARTDMRAGETVLVTGASGGVGSAAVQLARRRGGQVIALVSAEKAAEVRRLGAERVLPRDVNLAVTLARQSIDVVIDVVGGEQFPALLAVLRRGGRYAVAGAIAGPMVELDLRTLYLKDLRLLGCTIPQPSVFRDLVGYIERGEVRPVVARTYPLAAMADAQREFLTKRHTGKIVLLLE